MLIVLLIFASALCSADLNYDNYMAMQENGHGIPVNLLKAIASVESGKLVSGKIVPWPWTINVEGKGYIFKNKQEAIRAVRYHQMRGKASIDIGLMQVNLKHHPYAFRTLDEAFDPQLNIAYAARFLKELYLKNKSWRTAIAHYHSISPKYYKAYQQKVLQNWMHLCKSPTQSNSTTTQLAQTVLKFDELGRANPRTSTRTYAKVRKVYYNLEGNYNVRKTRNKTQKTLGRTYYTLD